MELSPQPVTLTLRQIEELNQKLSDMRHNINNCLAVVTAIVEIANRQPEAGLRLLNNLNELPARVGDEMQRFTADFERACQGLPH